jgi:rfaE bifunctional protein nucleotidyltransferase chain/domain
MHPDLSYKILDLAALQHRIAHWRIQGGRIVFTNGCFDILHLGHIELLHACRQVGDYLIVGLNADSSVTRLKGATRPINDQMSRAGVLAGIGVVDVVTIFDQDTPEALIHAIKPDILVKGGDYTLETIIGAAWVQSYGGQVRIIPTLAGYSTTSILGGKY